MKTKGILGKPPSQTMADFWLVTVTVFWGSTFILSKMVLEQIPLVTFLVIRLNIAAITMILISLRYKDQLNLKTIREGFILGIFLFLSYFFQMWGIQFTTASNAGFITGLSVVFVPLFSIIFFHDHPKKASLIGVLFATVGLYYLSGGDYLTLNKGDWLVFICALVVPFHVILTGRYAAHNNIYLLTAVQLSTIGILSLCLLPLQADPLFVVTSAVFALLIYLALFGTVYTFLMQTAMQRYTTATRTALVFSLEPVFAALFAFIVADEVLSSSGWFGGFLILCGMLIAEIHWESLVKKQKNKNIS
jgi:drug/metabolite transporter (DMT)-like permease